MRTNRRPVHIAALPAILLVFCGGAWLCAQSASSPKPEKEPVAPAGFSPTNEAELASVQEQLFKLLRMSPKLTSAVARDPSLLSYPDYVNRNNPELARFIQSRPDVARNPEFYLFGNLPGGGRNRDIQFLFQRAVWPEFTVGNTSQVEEAVIPFLVFLIVLASILWLLRVFLQNRRWGRIFKVQTEIHTKLLDKLGGSQELFAYLSTEAGKKFLELAPIAAAIQSPQQPSLLSPITRILAPLQVGVVSTLAGIGLLYIRTSFNNSGVLLLVGTIGIMLGIGLILSAAISWMLARRLGLMPQIKLGNSDAEAVPESNGRP